MDGYNPIIVRLIDDGSAVVVMVIIRCVRFEWLKVK